MRRRGANAATEGHVKSRASPPSERTRELPPSRADERSLRRRRDKETARGPPQRLLRGRDVSSRVVFPPRADGGSFRRFARDSDAAGVASGPRTYPASARLRGRSLPYRRTDRVAPAGSSLAYPLSGRNASPPPQEQWQTPVYQPGPSIRGGGGAGAYCWPPPFTIWCPP